MTTMHVRTEYTPRARGPRGTQSPGVAIAIASDTCWCVYSPDDFTTNQALANKVGTIFILTRPTEVTGAS